MKWAAGFVPVILWSVVAVNYRAVHGQTTPALNCPDLDLLKYEAAKYVADFFRNEAGNVQAYVQAAIQEKRNAKQALSNCYAEIRSAKSLKEARVGEAARMAKALSRLEGEKAALQAARDRALAEFNDAKPPHVASAADAAKARQEADAALRLANERSREAASAWAAANAAQQSTKWVPATNAKTGSSGKHNGGYNQQSAVSYGSPAGSPYNAGNVPPVLTKSTPDASKLTERAKAAEFAASVAQAEAKRLNDLANAAEEASRTVWDSMSPAVRAYHQAEAQYNSICLALSHQKANYDAAVLAINDATNLIFAKQAAEADAKARIKKAEKHIETLKGQLATILSVANYAQGLAEAIKAQLGSTTTGLPTTVTTPDAGATGTATTLPSVTTTGAGGGGGGNAAGFGNADPNLISAIRSVVDRFGGNPSPSNPDFLSALNSAVGRFNGGNVQSVPGMTGNAAPARSPVRSPARSFARSNMFSAFAALNRPRNVGRSPTVAGGRSSK